MRYSPFDKSLDDLIGGDLAILKGVSEGWYVEYKSALIETKALAKSLSAFANHYGGWLFLGVLEANGVAVAFPGLGPSETAEAELRLRNASKDCMNPSVFYTHRVINGPIPELELASDRAVIVVNVPLGVDAPYVHADGRIYRRVADASAPKPETDRAVLDLLWKRGTAARKRVKSLISRSPKVSQGESRSPFLHIFLSGDPLQQAGRAYRLGFNAFAGIMRDEPIPFDNIFSSSDGHVARQVKGNEPHRKVFTWEYSVLGHSWVTLPISCSNGDLPAVFGGYERFETFRTNLPSGDWLPMVLDLNILFAAVGAICTRHRRLLAVREFYGPFFIKVRIENIWRTAPFLDSDAYMEFVRTYGVPLVQADSAMVPPGIALASFLTLPKVVSPAVDVQVNDVAVLTGLLFSAFGIPFEVFQAVAPELGYLVERANLAQRIRSAYAT